MVEITTGGIGMAHKIRIKQSNMKTALTIDGIQLEGIKALVFSVGVDELPTLYLEMVAPDVMIDGETIIVDKDDEDEKSDE